MMRAGRRRRSVGGVRGPLRFGPSRRNGRAGKKMSATHAPQASTPTGFDRSDVGEVTLAFVDVRVRSLLVREVRRRAVTRTFGVPGEDQSFLVTIILLGAAATVLRKLVARPLPHGSGADAAIGGAVVNVALRGLAGSPSRAMPLAGALVGVAVLAHSVRPAVAGTVHEIRRLPHEVGMMLGIRHR